ncbi:phosphoribosyl-ATP diphosphatase [Isosphaera pallida ATCC 43644]|uniref:Phosphoribosyl-ATP pyrophosphatase n=1 Tax=Isosphaera pallida (strain ATCC 43644 / DSM 9630 / IS1B) TaxID=575540 RepID=E8R5S8_ISOPI|nr:phosphoribosyl-ATP diphosphatase [Isosphaera pallida]ADV62835.1 phosphoribosyl-ATP diphosphatase [Isosphaera pallida ATCC 43644]
MSIDTHKDFLIWQRLTEVIEERKRERSNRNSYVASLLNQGVEGINAKVIEEAGEVVEAAQEPGEQGVAHLVREVADLTFHCMVLLSARDSSWRAVEQELARRFGVGGLVEKAARAGSTAATDSDSTMPDPQPPN